MYTLFKISRSPRGRDVLEDISIEYSLKKGLWVVLKTFLGKEVVRSLKTKLTERPEEFIEQANANLSGSWFEACELGDLLVQVRNRGDHKWVHFSKEFYQDESMEGVCTVDLTVAELRMLVQILDEISK